MANRIYKLSFLTPVRFGMMSNTASLACIHADTLFSALFIALLEAGKEDSFLNAVREGRLLLSDGMPYQGENLFLPRPIGVYPATITETNPSTRKVLKKIQWIPLNCFQEWLTGSVKPEDLLVRFGRPVERTRVYRRPEEPTPYQVEGFRFNNDCGLYIIVQASSDEEMQLMDEGMKLLMAAGIGGLKSAGWGKFSYSIQDVPESLQHYLDNEKSEYQMLLNMALPAENEGEDAVAGANYVLVQRSGYTAGLGEISSLKQTVWLFAAGSTFRCRFDGDILNIATKSLHPVWRCAKAMMMGVNMP